MELFSKHPFLIFFIPTILSFLGLYISLLKFNFELEDIFHFLSFLWLLFVMYLVKMFT